MRSYGGYKTKQPEGTITMRRGKVLLWVRKNLGAKRQILKSNMSGKRDSNGKMPQEAGRRSGRPRRSRRRRRRRICPSSEERIQKRKLQEESMKIPSIKR